MRRAGSVSRLRVCCGGIDEAQEIRAGSGEFEGVQSKTSQPPTVPHSTQRSYTCTFEYDAVGGVGWRSTLRARAQSPDPNSAL